MAISGSREGLRNVKSLQTDGQTNKKVIRVAHLRDLSAQMWAEDGQS